MFSRRQDVVFKKLKALLAIFDVKRFHTGNWNAYGSHPDEEKHEVSKKKAQNIKRKNCISGLALAGLSVAKNCTEEGSFLVYQF